jgi:MFS family permease
MSKDRNGDQEGPPVTTAEAIRQPRGAFAALSSRSYRTYIGGQSLANTGTWMQSVAQDWLVFSLTHSPAAVGVTMALQFLPMLALGLHTGAAADRLPKRRILLATQTLNAAAVASLLIVSAGTGWVFAVNAACYLGPTVGLLRLRPSDRVPAPAARREPRALRTAVRYVRQRPDLVWTIFLVGILGTFGLNFPIVLTAMAKSAFHGDASTYGLFNIVLAIGSAAGALLAGAATRPRPRVIALSAALFGLLQVAAAIAPDMAVFLLLLSAMGFTNLAFQSMANACVQLAVDSGLRGRVMGLYMLVFIGGTPIGAPVIGALTNHFGARAGMAVCGVVPALAAAVMAATLVRRRGGAAPVSGGSS